MGNAESVSCDYHVQILIIRELFLAEKAQAKQKCSKDLQ